MAFSAAMMFLGTAPVSLGKSSSTVSCKLELDRAILIAGENQKAVLKITLDAPKPEKHDKRPSVNLCVVLDRSGSMSNANKLEKAKDAAIEALHRLGPKDYFSLVIYDHNVETVVPAQSAANTEWIESRIREIRPGGSTALFAGVSQGAAEVRKYCERKCVNRIILLSDGLANVGPSSPADLGRLGAGLMKEGIAVTTIGVGTDYNEDLMARLSQESDGNTYFVRDSNDLARIFNEELGDVLSVVAKKVKLIIECPRDVRPISIIGREGRIRGRTVELTLNQIYGGQEKFVLVEVEVAGAGDGDKKEIAVARISYENPFTSKEESSSERLESRFSRSRAEVDNSMNASVDKAYQMNINAEIQAKVIDLSDNGKTKEAAGMLKKSAAELYSTGRKYHDEALMKKADEMKEQAEKLEKEGMTAGSRKGFRSDSYQIMNQQRAH